MPVFGKTSTKNIMECDHRLQRILFTAIKLIDFTVICGFRGEADQHKAFMTGHSKLDWPKSKHNTYIIEAQEEGGQLVIPCSKAIDFIPCPFKGWEDIEGFKKVGALLKAVAGDLNIPCRYGGDWLHFKDYPHFEITV